MNTFEIYTFYYKKIQNPKLIVMGGGGPAAQPEAPTKAPGPPLTTGRLQPSPGGCYTIYIYI
jgi:hypothetical protein